MSETIAEIDPRELQELLRNDKDGGVRDAAVAEMRSLAADIKKRAEAGVTPDEFQRLTKIEVALLTGALVVTAAWSGYHRKAA